VIEEEQRVDAIQEELDKITGPEVEEKEQDSVLIDMRR
jgi:hypothetical protein